MPALTHVPTVLCTDVSAIRVCPTSPSFAESTAQALLPDLCSSQTEHDAVNRLHRLSPSALLASIQYSTLRLRGSWMKRAALPEYAELVRTLLKATSDVFHAFAGFPSMNGSSSNCTPIPQQPKMHPPPIRKHGQHLQWRCMGWYRCLRGMRAQSLRCS